MIHNKYQWATIKIGRHCLAVHRVPLPVAAPAVEMVHRIDRWSRLRYSPQGLRSLIAKLKGNHSPCLLFLLPQEIRDLIYVKVFEDEVVYIRISNDRLEMTRRERFEMWFRKRHQSSLFDRTKRGQGVASAIFGILTTCKQIHEESIQLFYRQAHFQFDWFHGREAARWLSSIPRAYMSLITDLRCDTAMWRMEFREWQHADGEQEQEALDFTATQIEKQGVALRSGVLKGSAFDAKTGERRWAERLYSGPPTRPRPSWYKECILL